MSTNARYALLDWDNTLREGFTITSWTKYLCDKSVIKKDAYCRLMNQFELYQTRKSSYEQLANTTTGIYAQALAGTELCTIEKMAYHFCQEDEAVFQFVNKLFKFFNRSNIDTIIVSGSPQVILLQYAKRFGISEVYGMDIEVIDGRYTGTVKQDYGAEKAHVVQEICYGRNSKPLIAFGDSASDKPLLEVAKYGYFFDRKKEMIVLNGHEIAPLSSVCAVIEEMSSSCDLDN